jgi:mono/diheme cytochrome c family protein
MVRRSGLLAVSLALFASGCGRAGGGESATPTPTPDPGPGWLVPPTTQRTGDPAAGWNHLVNDGYVGCGVPMDLFGLVKATGFATGEKIPGRNADNADLPYSWNSFPAGGVQVAMQNCLSCHASHVAGSLVIGLGETDFDYTIFGDFTASLAGWAGAGATLLPDPAARAELQQLTSRIQATSPYMQEKTIGANPAETISGVLAAHHDPQTLAWSDAALTALPQIDPVPLDVPPWWNTKKKNATFYTGAGQGDHSAFMMLASMFCVDSVDQAQHAYDYFGDIEAYIDSIQPPHWPYGTDAALAAQGKQVFEQTCSVCHGTYGANPTYPNRVLPLEYVGTDPELVNEIEQYGGPLIDWFSASFYGQNAQFNPYHGYIAPPLDGIWASAPYLHNGSVPTIEALLKSSTRPTYWMRTYDDTDYDTENVGWRYLTMDHGQADELDPFTRKKIYDTTLPGYSNAGHTFGDALSDADRLAVIAYLKTL